MELYERSTLIVKWYWSSYKDEYRRFSLDLEDLVQEGLITATKVMKRYKKGKASLSTQVRQMVTVRMKTLRRSGIRYSEAIGKLPNIEEESFDLREYKHIFFDVESVLSKEEYDILIKKIKEDKTFENIGKEVGLSTSKVFRLYRELVKKIKENYINSEIKQC